MTTEEQAVLLAELTKMAAKFEAAFEILFERIAALEADLAAANADAVEWRTEAGTLAEHLHAAKDQLTAKDAEIAALKEKLANTDAHAEHCRKETLKALEEQSRVANRASQWEAIWRAALRETREALSATSKAMRRSIDDGCTDHLDCCDDGGEFWYVSAEKAEAILARHAGLAKEGE
jgi:chromosome segregation ATPase